MLRQIGSHGSLVFVGRAASGKTFRTTRIMRAAEELKLELHLCCANCVIDERCDQSNPASLMFSLDSPRDMSEFKAMLADLPAKSYNQYVFSLFVTREELEADTELGQALQEREIEVVDVERITREHPTHPLARTDDIAADQRRISEWAKSWIIYRNTSVAPQVIIDHARNNKRASPIVLTAPITEASNSLFDFFGNPRSPEAWGRLMNFYLVMGVDFSSQGHYELVREEWSQVVDHVVHTFASVGWSGGLAVLMKLVISYL